MGKNSSVLIVFGYDRIIPPFMQTIIKEGLGIFDEIKYVTPPMPEVYYNTICHPKFEIITWTKGLRIRQYLAGALSIFRPSLWRELLKGKVSGNAIKNLGKLFFCSYVFMKLSNPIIKSALNEGKKIYMVGTWFYVDAFTIARLKKKFPNTYGCALAHSGEVMKSRNPFMHQCFHEYAFENLNNVFFISRKVLEKYLDDMVDVGIRDRFKDKISVKYLGSLKSSDKMNPDEARCFTLLSCSRIDSNKRLDRIISALEKWDGPRLRWIHIGTGILESEIRLKADALVRSNKRIDVVFTGRLKNDDVINFYSSNHVDLFVNVSKSEGLPVSIMEAMSYGIPCVATDVGGTSEIVSSSTGYLIKEDFKDEELLNCLYHFIHLPQDNRELLRKNSYDNWNKLFNAKSNIQFLFKDVLKVFNP